MTAEWKTTFCRYELDLGGPPGQVKVTSLDYLVEQTIDEVTGSRKGRVQESASNRVYPLPALLNVPEQVMTQWVKDALGPELVAQLEENSIPTIPEPVLNPPTGGFEPE